MVLDHDLTLLCALQMVDDWANLCRVLSFADLGLASSRLTGREQEHYKVATQARSNHLIPDPGHWPNSLSDGEGFTHSCWSENRQS